MKKLCYHLGVVDTLQILLTFLVEWDCPTYVAVETVGCKLHLVVPQFFRCTK